jgi:long-chain alkane monooxygenase
VREVAEFVGIGGMGAVVVGSPPSVADQLQASIDETDVDGFNLAYAVTPESFADFVQLLVPELQRRGVYERDHAPGTLRGKLYGQGHAGLPAPRNGRSIKESGAQPCAGLEGSQE